MTMSEGDDESVFWAEMADVRPLPVKARVPLRTVLTPEETLAARRAAAVSARQADPNPLSDEPPPPMDAWLQLAFKRPGVQHGVFRKLKQGRYAHDARLDLHRMTVATARRELFAFLEDARALGLRSVVIVHGKGRSDPTAPAKGSVLKACVDRWLRELPIVQAFHSALPQHGGGGAVYVLLAKSEASKRENRERFLKGRLPPP
jgi:DNA-nicking Smr family endonuclease